MGDNLYKDDSIESLDPRSHIQLRPGMYAGDLSNPNQLLMEVFSNALDEHNIGHGNLIDISIHDNGIINVEDQGQGIPVNVIREEDGKTVLEASCSVVNTSGKFTDNGVYEGTSLGLNGLGQKLVNFLSDRFEIISHKETGEYEHLWFENGILQKREVGEGFNWSGVTVTYKPSKKYFDTDKTDVKFFESFFNDICCLCPNLTIRLNGKAINHPDGISEILPRKVKDNIEILEAPFVYHYENGKNKIDLAMTFTGASSINITPYVNYGYTDSGPHLTSIKSTITRVLNNWARENKLLQKKDKNLDGNSIQEGMILVCNIVTTNVAYDAQIKSRVAKMDTSFISDSLGKELEIWLDNNPEDATKIIEKALIAKRATEAAKKAREAVKNKVKKKDKAFKLPTTLSDAWSKNRQKCELFICEGKSAASGLVAARDSETQAVYGVRGKMLSVLKTAPDKIVKNQEINNLLQALGLDYNLQNGKCKYDAKKLRYGKIIAAADADFDGYAIENLLFNILWYICPDLIIEGHVYSAVPPLYRITTKKNEYIYLRDDDALEEYKKGHSKNIQSLGRMKGLGEQDSEELSHCLLEPENRNIYQLTVSDVGKTDMMFENLYGKKVEPRVKFLSEHLEEARID